MIVYGDFFLSGLTNGLGRINTAQIENFGEVQYILSKDSEGVIPFFKLYKPKCNRNWSISTGNSFGLVIQRSSLTKEGEDSTQDVTFFSMDH